jgi:PBP1b-binding outer membrane lipoprotein LpoB
MKRIVLACVVLVVLLSGCTRENNCGPNGGQQCPPPTPFSTQTIPTIPTTMTPPPKTPAS